MMPTRRNAGQSWIPSIFNDFFDSNWMVKANATAPAINVMETEKEYKVEVAAPGMGKEDFSIQVNKENDLVITMEKKCDRAKCSGDNAAEIQKAEEKEKKEARYLRREFSYSKFQQTLILPDDVDKENICAKVNDGVLTICLPKIKPMAKVESARSIEIK
ncbi:MAG: Hsp20/alpha crystallin family protein [Bacteroidaceae bacterium]|nr:Hsp20/alpha crystallin family protein [Bacteroidaceae bacterium]